MLDVDGDPEPLVGPHARRSRRPGAVRRPHPRRSPRPGRGMRRRRRSCSQRLDECDARARSCSSPCTSRTATSTAPPTTRPSTLPRRIPRSPHGALARVDPNTGAAAVTELRRSARRGRARAEAAPARRGLHPRPPGRGGPDRGSRRRAPRAGADPRRPRHPRAGPGRRPPPARAHPRANLILAHAAISDLSWLWRVLPELPNVFVHDSLVEPRRHHRAVHAGRARPGAVGERLPVRRPARGCRAGAAVRRPGRPPHP